MVSDDFLRRFTPAPDIWENLETWEAAILEAEFSTAKLAEVERLVERRAQVDRISDAIRGDQAQRAMEAAQEPTAAESSTDYIPEPSPPQPMQASPDDVMFCMACGLRLPGDANFCLKCSRATNLGISA